MELDAENVKALKEAAQKVFEDVMAGKQVAGLTESQAADIRAAFAEADSMKVTLTLDASKTNKVRAAVYDEIADDEKAVAHFDVGLLLKITKTVGGVTSTVVENANVTEVAQALLITLDTGKKLNGDVRVLHDHDGVINEEEIVELDKAEGIVTVKLDKYSTLTVVDSKKIDPADDDDEDADDEDDKGVKTGDDNNLIAWLLLGLSSAVASGYFAKRRREN